MKLWNKSYVCGLPTRAGLGGGDVPKLTTKTTLRQLELGADDNIGRIPDQRRGAPDGATNSLRQIEGLGVAVDLLAQTNSQRTDQQNDCHIVQKRRHHAGHVGHHEEEGLAIVFRPLHQPDCEPLEKSRLCLWGRVSLILCTARHLFPVRL